MSIKAHLFTLLQFMLPHHLLSKWMRFLTHCEHKIWKNFMIRQVINLYRVNMNEAKDSNIETYASFNHFFTRELKEGIRPITLLTQGVASPADGVINQAGHINQSHIFQAKGKQFTVHELLGGKTQLSERFHQGIFQTLYLSPKDYHRLHMPLTGTLKKMIHIPGRLFSVNESTAQTVPRLFARNERVACIFDTQAGEMALILVGAIFVSSIETVWHGVVTPPTHAKIRSWDYHEQPPVLKKGEEMGRFNMGSTIIVLFTQDSVTWEKELHAGKALNVGELIGKITDEFTDPPYC